jgi:multidrug efflux pump subunit AcrA (membrane-fusion protein)
MRNTLLIGVVAVAIAGGGGAYAWHHYRAKPVAIDTIPTVEVRRGPFQVRLTSIGELRAARSSVLSSPFEGKITKLVEEGTRVEIGDPVIWFETDQIEEELEDRLAQLELDNKNLQATIEAYELEKIKNQYSLEAERTRVEIARQSFEDARQKFEAEKVLFERNVSPQTQLDTRRLALLQAELNLRNAQINLARVEENLAGTLRVREQDIERARLAVERTQRRVEEDQRKIESAVVRATSPGDISYLKIWKSGVAAKIVEGDQVWRRSNLVEIPDTSEMHVVIPVNEIDISRVELGQRAEIELVALPGRTFPGVVAGKSIVPISDPAARSWDRGGGDTPGPREFEVRVRVEGTSELFRQGMTALVHIFLDERADVLQVPLEAIGMRDGAIGVWTDGGMAPTFIPVTILSSNQHHAAVEAPLTAGQRLLLAPPTGEGTPGILIPQIEEDEAEGGVVTAAPAGGRQP